MFGADCRAQGCAQSHSEMETLEEGDIVGISDTLPGTPPETPIVTDEK